MPVGSEKNVGQNAAVPGRNDHFQWYFRLTYYYGVYNTRHVNTTMAVCQCNFCLLC